MEARGEGVLLGGGEDRLGTPRGKGVLVTSTRGGMILTGVWSDLGSVHYIRRHGRGVHRWASRALLLAPGIRALDSLVGMNGSLEI